MNIYFSGIGGVGLGPLAEIAKDAGYQVSGSDPLESLTTKELRKHDILVSKNQDGSFLQQCHNRHPIDWFIYTSALPDEHPELLLAKRLGIRVAKRDELLAYIIKDKKLRLIAIAGTHGKTTTTSMMVWTMQQLGLPVSYSIGTTIPFGPSGKFDPKSKYFVYECDEFDRNFLRFHPYLSLLSAVDYDHSDTYPTSDDYLEAFSQFARQSQHVITWRDQYGEFFADMDNVSVVENTSINESLKLFGEKNRRNATLVQLGLKYLKIDGDDNSILESFPGVDRRFERLADNLYSDYGHLPAEIEATLQLAREISNHVILIYQPHQNIRQYEIRSQYLDQFELAEEVYWLPTYLTREDPNLPILEPDDLIKNITNRSSIHVASLDDSLWQIIQKHRTKGHLVLIMGAGTVDGWVRDKLEKN